MGTVVIRDGSGTSKYAQVAKGTGTAADPYFLQVVAPVDYGQQQTVTVTTDTLLIAANVDRRSARLENKGPDKIEYWIGATAAGTFGNGFTLLAGGTYVIDSTNLHTKQIRATAQNGNAVVVVIEGV